MFLRGDTREVFAERKLALIRSGIINCESVVIVVKVGTLRKALTLASTARCALNDRPPHCSCTSHHSRLASHSHIYKYIHTIISLTSLINILRKLLHITERLLSKKLFLLLIRYTYILL